MKITFTFEHLNPAKPTICMKLKAKLNREPTHSELVAEVKRILATARV